MGKQIVDWEMEVINILIFLVWEKVTTSKRWRRSEHTRTPPNYLKEVRWTFEATLSFIIWFLIISSNLDLSNYNLQSSIIAPSEASNFTSPSKRSPKPSLPWEFYYWAVSISIILLLNRIPMILSCFQYSRFEKLAIQSYSESLLQILFYCCRPVSCLGTG